MIALIKDHFKILCDGNECREAADAPIALHPGLITGDLAMPPIDGWLFVASVGGGWRHYCPACQSVYLEGLREPIVRS